MVPFEVVKMIVLGNDGSTAAKQRPCHRCSVWPCCQEGQGVAAASRLGVDLQTSLNFLLGYLFHVALRERECPESVVRVRQIHGADRATCPASRLRRLSLWLWSASDPCWIAPDPESSSACRSLFRRCSSQASWIVLSLSSFTKFRLVIFTLGWQAFSWRNYPRSNFVIASPAR